MDCIRFIEWVGENHYRLHNIIDGVYYWRNETNEYSTDKLYIQYLMYKNIQ
jgi:hypothetical protein